MSYTISDFVKNNVEGQKNEVNFEFYRAGHFYYSVHRPYTYETYEFPVPVEDIGNATLLKKDTAITFMRWIRKAIENGTFIQQPPY